MRELTGRLVLGPGALVHGKVSFEDRIALVSPGGDEGGGGPVVAPGLVDLQVNGGWGHDFTARPETIWEVAARLPAHGVTAFLPTVVTAAYPSVERAIAVLAAGPPPGFRGARPLGLHIEGPWISPQWAGAHDPDLIRLPDPRVASEWAGSGVVCMVTMAPELTGAQECAEILAGSGVVVSMGHTDADYDTALGALSGSWSATTHLFNAMPPLSHRDPGPAGAALVSGRPCGLIADGEHVHPAALYLARKVLGDDRLILVSDAMAAVGLGPGAYRLGSRSVAVGTTTARLDSGKLAGSLLTLERAVLNLVRLGGASLAGALTAAGSVPAALVGAEGSGSLQPGAPADLVVLDPDSGIVETIVGGKTWG